MFRILVKFLIFNYFLVRVCLADDSVIKVGIPQDVLDDFHLFLADRTPQEVFTYRTKYSSRDVVETVLLFKILELNKNKYQFFTVNSYERAIKLVQSGTIDIYATTVWKNDVNPAKALFSDEIIRDGEFIAGIYVKEGSELLTKKFNIRTMKFLSNKAWTRDWKTIKNLGPRSLVSTTTWESVLKMINANRAEATLASFPPSRDLVRYNKIVNLVPIPNVKVSISGTRHWIVSRKSQHAQKLKARLDEMVPKFRKKKEFFKAYMQSGFFNERTVPWNVINRKGHL